VSDSVQFRRSGEWTMVYLNGQLQLAGDHYHADEWLQEHCGVEVVDDEAGLCIPDGHSALRTLAEVEAAELEYARRSEVAAAKRAEAQHLLDEAAEIMARS
jgi:hypothetical protein